MSVITATIASDGTVMDPEYEVLSIDTTLEVNRIPTAELTLLDGSASEADFPIGDSGFFEPGKEVEIKLRHDQEADVSVFKGLVVRQAVESGAGGSILTVELKDAAIKLTQSRRSVVFREQTDSDVIGKIIGDAGLTKGTIEATKPKLPEIVQYYSTDWDFILSRADSHGLVVVAEAGEVSVAKIDLNAAPAHEFEYGSDLYDFELEVDATHQYQAVEGLAWDLKNQKPTAAAKGKEFALQQTELKGDALAGKIGFGTFSLSHPVPLDPEELQAWADAGMIRSRMALFRGRLSVQGFGEINLLDVIKLDKFGKYYNGNSLVTGIRHRVDHDGWRTDIQFGLSPERFCRSPHIEAPAAGGLLPPVSGLQIGIVDPFEEDPDGEYRVKVTIPGIDETEGSLWARLASPDAGSKRGYFFRPEPGDEVIVGFFNGDPRQPVILGSLYGSKNTPAGALAPPSEENEEKGIFTRAGTALGFVDADKPSVFLETPAGNKVLLDEDSETVQLSDAQGNEITMDKNGITIKSAKDLKIEASGNVEIKGAKVDVK